MQPNVGETDRLIRLMVGAICVLLAIFGHWIFWILALLAFATGWFRFCLLYKILGKNTCEPQTK
jgi:hypothetical protein